MDIFFDEILNSKNKPIIEDEYNPQNHLILSKYTSKVYYKYSIELLKTLIKKSEYNNKLYIFHMSLYYLLKILYNFKSIAYIDNYDLLILCSFSLGIKVTVDQHKTPFITKLKNIYPEKYLSYTNAEIIECEIICMKLLNYNINILTSYECLYFLFSKDINKFPLLINELENIIFNNINEILFKKPYELALEAVNKFNSKYQNIKQPLLITKKTAPFLNKKDTKNNNESTPTTSISTSYGSCNNTRNNFNSKKLKGLRSQSNYELNNKNIINNINKELNDIYKNNNYIEIRCINSVNKEDKNKKDCNSSYNIKNKEIKKIIYKNNNYNNNKFIKINENRIINNNIKILNNYVQNKSISTDIYNTYINTSANKNTSSKNIGESLQKMQINKYLCFSSKKSPIKTNSRVSIIDNNNNIKIKIHVNNNNKLLNNLSSNNLKNARIQNSSGTTIFKKPTIDKQKMKTSFKNKKNKKSNKNNKKEFNFNSALKNVNIHYRKITDLCKKINFEVFNNISEKDKSHN